MRVRRPGDGLAHGALLVAIGSSLACGHGQEPTLEGPELEVEYGGCWEVLEPGAACILGSRRELRLWIGGVAQTRVELRIDGRRVDAVVEAVREGKRFIVQVPLGAKKVDASVEAPGGRAAWSLPLEKRQTGETRLGMVEELNKRADLVYQAILSRDLEGARGLLAGFQLPSKAPAEIRCLLPYLKALLAEREGDYRSALAEIARTIEITDRVSADRLLWLAQEERALLLRGIGRSKEAAKLFEALVNSPHPRNSCETAQLLNNQAWSTLLARETGERLEDPTRLLEQALATYETCEGVTAEKSVNILLNLALAHLQEGRLPQAKALLLQSHQLEPHPPLPHTLWWLDLEGRFALSEQRTAEALRLFKELGELAAETSSFDSMLRAAFGQAQAYLALKKGGPALRILGQAEALLDEQSLQIPIHEGRERFVVARRAIVSLRIDILLDQRRIAEALAVARHARSRVLRQLADAYRLETLSPNQRTQRARLLADYDARRAALEARASEDWKLPADQLGQERAARKAEAEVAQRLLDEAFLVLGGPSTGSVAESPPRPGELLLVYHPLAPGWVGFAADGTTVEAHRFELPPTLLSEPKKLAERLLLPYRARIERAERLRVLTSGPLDSVDFQALPFSGGVLLAGRPVVYGLDLPVAQHAPRPPGRQALLVTNPRGDLPGAVLESKAVRETLASGAGPWACKELTGDEASVPAVRTSLATTDLLHYAGHGSFSGLDGWESSLLLADETQLTLGDLLALEAVPTWVVLSGCDTGRSAAEIPVAGLGLAHAFLLAGSRAVVASTRPADDKSVLAFFAELYRQWAREPDLAVALQRAQLSWRQQFPSADWAGFRLFEP